MPTCTLTAPFIHQAASKYRDTPSGQPALLLLPKMTVPGTFSLYPMSFAICTQQHEPQTSVEVFCRRKHQGPLPVVTQSSSSPITQSKVLKVPALQLCVQTKTSSTIVRADSGLSVEGLQQFSLPAGCDLILSTLDSAQTEEHTLRNLQHTFDGGTEYPSSWNAKLRATIPPPPDYSCWKLALSVLPLARLTRDLRI